jgi:hypothetical protein
MAMFQTKLSYLKQITTINCGSSATPNTVVLQIVQELANEYELKEL